MYKELKESMKTMSHKIEISRGDKVKKESEKIWSLKVQK